MGEDNVCHPDNNDPMTAATSTFQGWMIIVTVETHRLNERRHAHRKYPVKKNMRQLGEVL